jgi:ADP-ribose pyrophosphatase YjhB (NUDIX family)
MKKGVDFTGITTSFCCHDGKGNILMQKRSHKCRDEQGNWDIGSGSLEFGLSPEENMKKEIKEEYGVEPKKVTHIGTRSVKRKLSDGTQTHWVAFDYLVEVEREKVKNGEPESIDEIAWFTPDSLPNPLHSQMMKFLELYKEHIQNLY